jgi:hypothetical protein
MTMVGSNVVGDLDSTLQANTSHSFDFGLMVFELVCCCMY